MTSSQHSRIDTTRRLFLSSAAGLAAGGTALALAIPSASSASAAAQVLAQPDTAKASPELREAVSKLMDAHDELVVARARVVEADTKMDAWHDENPQPDGKRPYKRWARRSNDAWEEIMGGSLDAQREAEKLFRKARLAVAEIRPADMNDLALMAAAAGTYDEEFLTVGQVGDDFLRCRARLGRFSANAASPRSTAWIAIRTGVQTTACRDRGHPAPVPFFVWRLSTETLPL
jgi:hypothetical protein